MALDRLANDADLVQNVVQNGIDEVDALRLYHDGKHPKVFSFAMALGAGLEKRDTIAKSKNNWLQYSALNNGDSEIRSYAVSLALFELRKSQEDNLMNKDEEIYTIAAEYANTGFKKIKEMIPDFTKYDEDDFVQQLIEMMDEKYYEIISE